MAVIGEDQPLIEAARAGDPEAFGELVGRYADRLFPTLVRLTGSPEDARDLLQDVFIRAYRKLGRFHGESSFFTWLYRLAVNLAISSRRRKVTRTIRMSELEGATSGPPIDLSDDPDRTDPGQPLDRSEQAAVIHAAMQTLDPDHRAVLVLKEFDGLSYEEIAAVLGVPVGTVRSRLHRARSALRERLQPWWDGESSGGTPPSSLAPPVRPPADPGSRKGPGT